VSIGDREALRPTVAGQGSSGPCASAFARAPGTKGLRCDVSDHEPRGVHGTL